MAIKNEDFLSFAKALPEDNEINLRNSISRAYYAAYHGCFDIYRPVHSANAGVHKQLIDSLTSSSVVKDRQIGYILGQLKQFRRTADYDLPASVTLSDKQTSIRQTEKLMELLRNN